jgi:hypothetical protein
VAAQHTYKSLCRDVFKYRFQIATDDDFILHESADPALVEAHQEGKAMPNKHDLRFDMTSGADSKWNEAVIDILLSTMKKHHKKSPIRLPKRSDQYLRDMIYEKYKRVQKAWKSGQPKAMDDGVEGPEEVEKRLLNKKELQLAIARERGRRVLVSHQ